MNKWQRRKKMKITNVKVYDLEESIVASGLPMMAEYDETECGKAVRELFLCHLTGDIQDNSHFKRACKLAANPPGSGHNNFLSGIVVSMNVTATNVWWMQLERYHFVQIVSSQSKMHRLRQMVASGNKDIYHDKVHPDYYLDTDETFDDEYLAYNCPMGLELTARITTNYLALKTIYNQRHNHRLQEWRDFCKEIETLPFAAELILKK
jgi:hypothetical protein